MNNLFKNFNIDHDKIEIDDYVVYRPDYIPLSKWVDFWRRTEEEPINEIELNNRINSEIDDACRQLKEELEEEFSFRKTKASENIWNFIDNKELIFDDKIRKFILSEIDKIVENL